MLPLFLFHLCVPFYCIFFNWKLFATKLSFYQKALQCCLQHIHCSDSLDLVTFFIFILPFRQTITITNWSGKVKNKLMIYLILNEYLKNTSVVHHNLSVAIFLDAYKKRACKYISYYAISLWKWMFRSILETVPLRRLTPTEFPLKHSSWDACSIGDIPAVVSNVLRPEALAGAFGMY